MKCHSSQSWCNTALTWQPGDLWGWSEAVIPLSLQDTRLLVSVTALWCVTVMLWEEWMQRSCVMKRWTSPSKLLYFPLTHTHTHTHTHSFTLMFSCHFLHQMTKTDTHYLYIFIMISPFGKQNIWTSSTYSNTLRLLLEHSFKSLTLRRGWLNDQLQQGANQQCSVKNM